MSNLNHMNKVTYSHQSSSEANTDNTLHPYENCVWYAIFKVKTDATYNSLFMLTFWVKTIFRRFKWSLFSNYF